jgi:hypothetical protein
MAKHKYIETPEKMWELFTQYKEWVRDNPILVEDYVGKDADKVDRKRQRALTMEGFECFVMDKTDITYPDLSHYFSSNDENYKDYFAICSRIKREIRSNQLDLGLANVINTSITQRLNGLKEQTETKTTIEGVSKITIE